MESEENKGLSENALYDRTTRKAFVAEEICGKLILKSVQMTLSVFRWIK